MSNSDKTKRDSERDPQRDDLDQFRTRKKSEIVSNLIELSRAIEPLTILFDTGKHSFPTSVIAVVSDNTEVVFERASNKDLNQKLIAAGKGSVIGQPDGIKLRFVLEHIRADKHAGEDVLIATIPTEHYRMQRRRFFRINTLIREPVTVTIALPNQEEFALNVGNISSGGLRLNDTDHQLMCKTHQIFEGCKLQIPHAEAFSIDLCVTAAQVKKTRNGNTVQYVGCEFVELTAKQEHEVQKYINTLQLAQRAMAK